MSNLTNELKRIFEWLKRATPNTVSLYNPGLSRKQIDKSVGDLEFKLSEEWYELYQLCNGFNFASLLASSNHNPAPEFFFPEQLHADNPVAFCSLQDAISSYNSKIDADIAVGPDYEYWDKNWFPIAAYETKRMLYIVGGLEPSPVYLWDVDSPNVLRIYKNLTSMMSVIAECCEHNLYQVIPDEYGEEEQMVIRINEEQLDLEKSIYKKYNS